MADVEAVRAEVIKKLSHVVDLSDDILRGDRQYEERVFAVTYVDLSDNIVERSRNLASFQEKLLGEKFFDGENNQRWNSYLYLWAGPKSRAQKGFKEAKISIEQDRHFARKFVLNEDELIDRIGDLSLVRPKTVIHDDALGKWARELYESDFDAVLERRPRAELIRMIESGKAFSRSGDAIVKAPMTSTSPLGSGFLRSLQVKEFRPVIGEREFVFGDVNLIVGQNGTGKTSLLELIEMLYCGYIRRDSAAVVRGLRAGLEMPDGKSEEVKGTTSSASIKSRSLAWYGRSDHRANSISEGFTRFNFLDTDAAFRLSSETDVQRIKDVLDKLLVGPETSSLWSYITKLHDDIEASLRSFNEKLPTLKNQRELLNAEVDRLKGAPSEAGSLAKTYRASLRAIGAKWRFGDSNDPVQESDRLRLESLVRGLRRASAFPGAVHATPEALRVKRDVIQTVISSVRDFCQEYESIEQNLGRRRDCLIECQEVIATLQQWFEFCKAGIPQLLGKMERADSRISSLRASLAGAPIDSISEIPSQYASLTLQSAKKSVGGNLALAEEQERGIIESIKEREKIGRSLRALRIELREIAGTIMDRVGDPRHCPVCGTHHEQEELARKIDSLVSASDPLVDQGLSSALINSKSQADRVRSLAITIRVLSRYAAANGMSDAVTVQEIAHWFFAEHSELNALLSDRDQFFMAMESIYPSGFDMDDYEECRHAVASILNLGVEKLGAVNIQSELEVRRDRLRVEQDEVSMLEGQLQNIEAEVRAIVQNLGFMRDGKAAPAALKSDLERALEYLDSSFSFIQEASQEIEIFDTRSIKDIVVSVEEAMEAFDRARYAASQEVGARDNLENVIRKFKAVDEKIERLTSKKDNLRRASLIINRIRSDFSLEDATRSAVQSIRRQISYIFGRIHTPSEYELGDFDDASLLLTRDGGFSRGVNQVSTGQRAALALSIFLSLNESAESAPPIMLIDDPVAHVDDLNILSFFDYLRDLAVSERKQIFFATADTRIAALFEKKFEFLGGGLFRKIALSK